MLKQKLNLQNMTIELVNGLSLSQQILNNLNTKAQQLLAFK